MKSKENQPNVLWICTDQQRFNSLGCYGNDLVDTPNLDKLAQNGILFENCYSQSPVCTPSRASFLSGRYPRTTRCRQNGQSIPGEEKLVTKMFSDNGYICGLSGKLHISPAHPSVNKGTERRIDDGYDIFHWSHHPHEDWPTNEYTSWLREKGLTYSPEDCPQSDYINYGMSEKNHQTTWCVDKAINFVKSNAKFETPWLFSLNPFDPHHAFDPPQEYLKKYMEKLDEIPLPNYQEGELKNKPIFQRIDHNGSYGGIGFNYDKMNEKDHKMVRAAYWAMVDLIDHQIGRLIDSLKETEQWGNTIVIFTSDHGEMLGDHGIYWKGPYFYEPAVHVPLIITYPQEITKEQKSEALVELTDLAPTLLEAAGMKKDPGMQGKSLWHILKGEKSLHNHRDSVYCEYYNAMPWHECPQPHGTMVFDGHYKLINIHGIDEGELYNLKKDQNEQNNLWKNKDYQQVKIDMLELLSDRMAFTVDPLPERESAW